MNLTLIAICAGAELAYFRFLHLSLRLARLRCVCEEERELLLNGDYGMFTLASSAVPCSRSGNENARRKQIVNRNKKFEFTALFLSVCLLYRLIASNQDLRSSKHVILSLAPLPSLARGNRIRVNLRGFCNTRINKWLVRGLSIISCGS